MTSYRIRELLRRFDARADTAVTGRISSFLGETILKEAVAHWLLSTGHTVELLPGVPTRDDTAFGTNCPKPKVRDLDAWFLLDDTELAAVECKTTTASSMDGKPVPDDPAELAAFSRTEWSAMVAAHIDTRNWTRTNKVFLPLRPPRGLDPAVAEAAMAGMRRILAVWRPTSRDGAAFVSEVTSDSVHDDQSVPATAEVFSASLYLRSLLDRGELLLPARLGATEQLMNAATEILGP